MTIDYKARIQRQFVQKYNHFFGHLPIVGPWYSRINRVQQILATPDSPSPEIWVYAFFSALPRLLWTFEKPFLIADQFHGRLPGPRSKNKMNAKIGGELIPEIEELEGPAWYVFKVTAELALKAEWYFFIIDRTTEFLLNWVSLAYTYNSDRIPGGAGQMASGLLEKWPTGAPNGEYLEFPTWQAWGGAAQPSWVVTVPAGTSGQVTLMGQITDVSKPPIFNTPADGIELRDYATGQVLERHDIQDASKGEYFAKMHTFTLPKVLGPKLYCGVLTGAPYGQSNVDGELKAYWYKTGSKGLDFDP